LQKNATHGANDQAKMPSPTAANPIDPRPASLLRRGKDRAKVDRLCVLEQAVALVSSRKMEKFVSRHFERIWDSNLWNFLAG